MKPKKAPAPKGWTCGCGVQQPHYLLFCKRCGGSAPKQRKESVS